MTFKINNFLLSKEYCLYFVLRWGWVKGPTQCQRNVLKRWISPFCITGNYKKLILGVSFIEDEEQRTSRQSGSCSHGTSTQVTWATNFVFIKNEYTWNNERVQIKYEFQSWKIHWIWIIWCAQSCSDPWAGETQREEFEFSFMGWLHQCIMRGTLKNRATLMGWRPHRPWRALLIVEF